MTTPERNSSIAVNEAVTHGWDRPEGWFVAEALDRGLKLHVRGPSMPVVPDAMERFLGGSTVISGTWYADEDDEALSPAATPSFAITVSDDGNLVTALVVYTSGEGIALAASSDRARASAEVDRLGNDLRRDRSVPTDNVAASFWVLGPHGSQSYSRRIAVRPLDDVLGGVSPEARTRLQSVADQTPPVGGVHVWHGPPGCGKSTVIRSLAHAWTEHVQLDVVIDPEKLLDDANYLLSVLNGFRSGGENERRRMIVLEDSGELVSVDARSRVGHGLSRLLNLTDGMFGHDETPIVVITTNEPVGKMHPAILRSGRCRSVIEFGPLSITDSVAWLERHGVASHDIHEPTTLAELAAIVDGTTPIGAEQVASPFGFTG